MKKTYNKPEIYSEDVSIAFAQNCCPALENPSGINQGMSFFCTGCVINVTYEYIKC